MLRMNQCPKYENCEAPLCPLDEEWKKRSMLQDEHLCHYLCEASKLGVEERFNGRSDQAIFMQALGLADEMRKFSTALNRGLERASKSPSVIPKIQLDLDLD